MTSRIAVRLVVVSGVMVLLAGVAASSSVSAGPTQGKYFAKKEYLPEPLPKFAQTKARLPAPIYDENPRYVQMYWKTWELAFRNFSSSKFDRKR